MQHSKRPLETDAYSESSSPKRAMSVHSEPQSPPPPSTALAQAETEGMEDLHLSSSDPDETPAPSHAALPAPATSDSTGSLAVSSSTPPATATTVASSSMGDELEAQLQEDNTHDLLTSAEKLEMITNFKKQPLNTGDFWFLIDRKWYRRFSTLMEDDPTPPSLDSLRPITNSPLFVNEGPTLALHLQEGVDVEMVPEAAWKMLVLWFGFDREVKRKVIPGGGGPGNERVEFYEPTLTVHLIAPPVIGPDPTGRAHTFLEPHVVKISSSTSFKMFFVQLCRHNKFKLTPSSTRLWRLADASAQAGGGGGLPAILSVGQAKENGADLVRAGEEKETLETLSLGDGVVLALEVAFEGTWPMTGDPAGPISLPTTTKTNQSGGPLFAAPGFVASLEGRNAVASGSGERKDEPSSGLKKGFMSGVAGMLTRSKSHGPVEGGKGKGGLMGLSNLGNTCFMNSAIQCMSNTTELNRYFLSGVYKDEINRSNPLGMKGQVADAFGDLITRLHHGHSSSYSPSDFKRTLARFAPSFSGYQQHDSQEFITFLLDGLHEDLNRIKKKPYAESPDWLGGGDVELAKLARDCWEIYKKRNDSVIVDLFQGQYKSTLICPKCAKVSITFDPFMYLTLPVPVTKRIQHKVLFIPRSGVRYEIELSVPKEISFKGVKSLIGSWFDVDPATIYAGEIWHSTFYKSFADHDPFGEIQTADVIVFYEVGTKLQVRHDTVRTEDKSTFVIPVFTARDTRSQEYNRGGDAPDPVGAPFFITLSAEQARDEQAIVDAILEQYIRLVPDSTPMTFMRAVAPAPASAEKDVDELMEEEEEASATEGEMDVEEESVAPMQIYASGLNVPTPPTTSIFPDGTIASDLTPLPSTDLTSTAPSPAVIDPTLVDGASAAVPTSAALPQLRTLFEPFVFEERRNYSGSIPDGKDLSQLVPLGAPFRGRPAVQRPLFGNRLDSSSNPTSDDDADDESRPASFVQHGVGIVCVWSKRDLVNLLGSKSSSAFDMGYEKFVDPSLAAEMGKRRTKAVLSIQDCLDEFSKEETLGEDDLWYCSNCKEHQAATKKLELWKTPDILVVHLKRFGGSRGLRDKIDNLIEFPVTDFDLADRVLERQVVQSIELAGGSTEELGLESSKEPLIYDLYGVDQHFGGLGGGHYTAAAKSGEDGNWYNFDDSHVSPISNPASVVTPAAYVLFYRRRVQTREIGGETRLKVEQAIKNRSARNSSAPTATESPSTSALNSGRNSPVSLWSASLANRFASSGIPSVGAYPIPPSPAASMDNNVDGDYAPSSPASSVSSSPSSSLSPRLSLAHSPDWASSDLSTSSDRPPTYTPLSPALSTTADEVLEGADEDEPRLAPPLEPFRSINDDYDDDEGPSNATSTTTSVDGESSTGFVFVEKQ